MKRGSFITPLLLILIGVVFLLKNINPELRVFQFLFDWWPVLLITWGGLRLLEILVSYFRGQALPVAGVSGGEWALIVILTVVGSSVWGVQRLTRVDFGNFRIGGMDVFSETFDYPLDPVAQTAGAAPRIVIENLRGSVRVIGSETNEVRVTGRKSIRAMSRADADTAHEKTPVDFTAAGSVVTLRTWHEKAEDARIRSNIEITAPKGASVEVRGRDVDVDVADLEGTVDVVSDRAGVRLQNIGGKVRTDLRGSDIIRGFDIRGDVELKGRGRDIELENVTGQVTINGSYSGETVLRRVAKPVRFDSSVTNIRFDGLPGEMRLSLNNMSAQNVTGPVEVRTRSKDVELAEVAGSVKVETDRGDVAVRQSTGPKAPIQVEVRSGNIDLALPAGAAFTLDAETSRGAVVNDFNPDLKETESERGATLKGALGAGPEIRLKTSRGEVSVRKIAPIETPAPARPRKGGAVPPAPKREEY
jgi:DUF4097 and DUF4098 domain-containing protein YvlB